MKNNNSNPTVDDLLAKVHTLEDEVLLWKRRSELEKEESKKKAKSSDWLIISIIVIFLLIAFSPFSKTEFLVEPNENIVYGIKSSWFGFQKEYKEIKWMKTADNYYPAWMAKNKNGEWYIYIGDVKEASVK
ncbi:MAG TPA: hypothetical protein QF468_13300 [Nitrospinota bacterium]|jgi:hypothetical protein|nr:hypothetical protein [Nitrospinota bacterium]|tara:strand:- start:1512 stop:1904 length:393 start_codon:yes stop_codon:yes gene_type:complete